MDTKSAENVEPLMSGDHSLSAATGVPTNAPVESPGLLRITLRTAGRIWRAILGGSLAKKSGWDWLELLVVPAALASVGVWFGVTSHREDRAIADQHQRQATLQDYYDYLTDLLLVHSLGESEYRSTPRSLARARTLATVASLDGWSKGEVVMFLYESNLIKLESPIVVLGGADLSGAELHEAYLSYANLQGANLSRADLSAARLTGANLRRADLRDADLSGAGLDNAELFGVILVRSNLRGAKLNEAELWAADLREADMTGAQLTRADLHEADLRGADLRGAFMDRADLDRADLRGADLRGARVSIDQMQVTTHYGSAKLPDGIPADERGEP